MEYEVVVVGGGIGGLTVAALLAARGVSVCLCERQAQVGGCVANFEFQGYTFEPTSGLYAGWEPGGIHERIFSELPVDRPQVRRLSPGYVVRLPDAEIEVAEQPDRFEANLRTAFPECADAAVSFYRKLDRCAQALLAENDHPRQFESGADTAAAHLGDTSQRFQRFVDLQLQTFDLCGCADAHDTLSGIVVNQGWRADAG